VNQAPPRLIKLADLDFLEQQLDTTPVEAKPFWPAPQGRRTYVCGPPRASQIRPRPAASTPFDGLGRIVPSRFYHYPARLVS
jgi:hypothetical protein